MEDHSLVITWTRDLEFLVNELSEELREDNTSEYALHEAETVNRILVTASGMPTVFGKKLAQQMFHWIEQLETLRFRRRTAKKPGFAPSGIRCRRPASDRADEVAGHHPGHVLPLLPRGGPGEGAPAGRVRGPLLPAVPPRLRRAEASPEQVEVPRVRHQAARMLPLPPARTGGRRGREGQEAELRVLRAVAAR